MADLQQVHLIHDRTGGVVATNVELAQTRKARRVGLLGRAAMDPTEALVLTPCFAIHTCFMRFPIDVLFIDHEGRAVRMIHALKPWRLAASPHAAGVIELAAGVLERHQVQAGDRLLLENRC